MRFLSRFSRIAALGLACGLGTLTLTQPAKAYYLAPGVIVAPAPVVVAPPPVVVAPPVVLAPAPRVVYAPYPGARWIHPHYNRWGRFIPGHWV